MSGQEVARPGACVLSQFLIGDGADAHQHGVAGQPLAVVQHNGRGPSALGLDGADRAAEHEPHAPRAVMAQ